jgi:hypothetical protein
MSRIFTTSRPAADSLSPGTAGTAAGVARVQDRAGGGKPQAGLKFSFTGRAAGRWN